LNQLGKLSPAEYRSQIPYFRSGRYFFDSASSTLLSDATLKATIEFYELGGTKPSHGLYKGATIANQITEEARSTLAKVLKVDSESIGFPPNVPTAVLHALNFLKSKHGSTTIVYTDDLTHDTLLPIRNYTRLFNHRGLQLNTGDNVDDWYSKIDQLDNNEGVILALPWYSPFGESYDKRKFAQEVKTRFGAKILLDGVTGAVLGEDGGLFGEAQCVVFDSNVGWGGPIGLGILLNRDYQDDFSPFLLAGSGTVKEVTKTEEKYQDYPECIETSLNPGVLSGLKTSAELLHRIIEEARRHAENLTKELRKQISELSSVYLPEEILNNPRTHITGFYFSSLTAHEVAVFLDEIKKVDIRSGSFCAHQLVARVLSGIETEGAMQCAFHYYNQFSDVEYLVNSITECLRTFGIDH